MDTSPDHIYPARAAHEGLTIVVHNIGVYLGGGIHPPLKLTN